MDKVTLKEIREHCDRQCVRYGINKDSDYYKEHYLIRELLDEIHCDIEEYEKKIKAELLDKVAEKIREHSGLHYVDCDGYFGGIAELIFKVDYWLDDIIAELKAEVSE